MKSASWLVRLTRWSSVVDHGRAHSQRLDGGQQPRPGLVRLSGGAYEGMEQQSGEITSMAGAVEEFSATSLNIADNMGNTQRLAQENAQQTRIGVNVRRWTKRPRPWSKSPVH